MEAYLIKMICCSGLLFGYYRLALYNERFHQWNRFYLLAAIAISIAAPLVNIPVVANEGNANLAYYMDNMPWNYSAPVAEETISFWQIAAMIGSAISLFFIARLLFGIGKIIGIYRKHAATPLVNNVQLIVTKLSEAPFSFFNWLFWRHDVDPASENGQRMLNHELTHIREQHSIDKMFSSIVLCLFWMNPFFWLMRRELNTIHEFLADRKAIRSQDGAAFAQMILQAVPTKSNGFDGLINPFFSSQIKRRLFMITTSNNAKYSYLRRISGLAIMICMGISLTLSVQHAEAQKTETKIIIKEKMATTDEGKSSNKSESSSATSPKPADARNKAEKKSPLGERKEQIVTKNPPLYIVDGKETHASVMRDMAPESINSIDVLKGEHATEKYGEKGKNGVIIISTKSGGNQNFDGLATVISSAGDQPLYFINGKAATKEAIDKLDKDAIKTVNVLKGESATKKHGDKAKGGVVEITLKEAL
ncbi:M56 family metallopeptidase [Aridibaculum aurantiacum]|uniref:M56 family metallopeptidase n=1 Tax=Aridibaculum aurantiacum TaxID=2810307 RepID=UPI001A97A5EC|nr:M56 family metallopeptidase [Aridibaculum aurantiacum]